MRASIRNCVAAVVVLCGGAARADGGVQTPHKIDAKAVLERVHLGGGEHLPRFAVSPRQDAVVFATLALRVDQNDYVGRWYVLELDGQQRLRPVGDSGDLMLDIRQRGTVNGATVGSPPRWSPDGRWIAYAKQTGDEIQIWRSSRDGAVHEQVTFNAANVFGSNAYEALFAWSADGSKIYYEVARTRAGMARQMAQDGRRGHLYDQRFFPGVAYKPIWMRCGGFRSGHQPVKSQACEPTLWTHDLTARQDRLATDEERAEYDRLKAPADGVGFDDRVGRTKIVKAEDGTLVWLENIDPETYRGLRPPLRLMVSLPDGQTRGCEADICNSQFLEAAWKIGDDIVFLRHEGEKKIDTIGLWAFYAWSPGTGDVRRLIRTADYFFECKPARGELVCFHETPVQPRRLVALDVRSGAVRELYNPNPHLTAGLFTTVEYIEAHDTQARSVYGKLVYPRDYQAGRTYPLVLVQGSFRGFLDGGTGNEYPIHLLADKGFFVLNTTEYQDFDADARMRGYEMMKAEFVEFGRRKRALAAFTDMIGDLVGRGLVDPARVAVTGLSSGSSNARYSLINGELFSAAALSTGYSGPQQYWFASSHRRWWSETYVGGALPFEEAAETFMAGEQLGWHTRKRAFPPVLWQVADSELSHALFDHALLQDEGHPVEMYVFPDELHIKWQPIHRLAVQRRNIQWMTFWLQGETVDDPMDPDQYARWAALCAGYVEKLTASGDKAHRQRAKQQRCTRVAVD